jgi:hypothetical protein
MRRRAPAAPIRTSVGAILTALALVACGQQSTTTGHAQQSSTTGHSRTASQPGGPVTVTPATGGPRTIFIVHFVARASVAPVGGSGVDYTAAVSGAAGSAAAHCLGATSVQARAATKGLPTMIALDPAGVGGSWCTGIHRVRVIELQGPRCASGMMCPQFVRVIATVGTATFRVTNPGG